MTRHQRLTLLAAILGSGVATLDGSIVNVALPSIERDLGGGLSGQQWIVNGYVLTLGSFILLGGSLGDVIGRRRVFVGAVAAFGVCSVACAAAPSLGVLIGARAMEGVAGALLVPSSLAAIVQAFPQAQRGAAVGAWTAWTGIALIIGPLTGGLIVGAASWRWIFVINVPLVIATITLIRNSLTDEGTGSGRQIDWLGALLCVIGLGGVVFALIEEAHLGWGSPLIFLTMAAGASALVAFWSWERHAPDPMVELGLFQRRNFSVANISTFAIYSALSILILFLVLFLQQDAGYSALKSGFTTLPTTLVMFALSRRFGNLADRYGARAFMGIGPLLAAAGVLILSRAHPPVNYFTDLLPGILVFGLGLSMTVAPLTATVLAGVGDDDAGIASGINNAVARVAGLIGTSVVAVLITDQLPRRVFGADAASTHAFHLVMFMCAGLLATGGIISAVWIANPPQQVPAGDSTGGQLSAAAKASVPG